jgi:hypothetical protein
MTELVPVADRLEEWAAELRDAFEPGRRTTEITEWFLRLRRKRRNLDVLLEDSMEAGKRAVAAWPELNEFVRSGAGTPDDQLAKVLHTHRLNEIAGLRVEAFHVFAKLLLDHAAQAVRVLFRGKDGKPQKHSQMENLAAYADAKGLTSPSKRLGELIQELASQVSAFRDSHVVHDINPLVSMAPVLRSDGLTTMTAFLLGGVDRLPDVTGSHPLPVLLAKIDEYLNELIDWMQENLARADGLLQEP